jgi:hypothetical protein
MPRKAATSQSTELIRAVTGTGKTRGESLLGSPELKKAFKAAKKAEAARNRKTRKQGQ